MMPCILPRTAASRNTWPDIRGRPRAINQRFETTTMSVRIDPATGLKTFATRAAKATDRIAGKGYSIVTDESLKTLPRAAARRHVQCAGAGEVPRVQGSARAAPPTTWRWKASSRSTSTTCIPRDPVPREALTDECEILVVGAGFAGLLLWHKLRDAGFSDVRFCEKGGDVGGTWYWNRYPGIACDVEVLQLSAAARGDGLRPDDEVRVGLRDSRVLPEDGRQVRLLRSLPVPHDRRRDRRGTKRPAAGP